MESVALARSLLLASALALIASAPLHVHADDAERQSFAIDKLVRIPPETTLRSKSEQIAGALAAEPELLSFRKPDGATALHEAAKYGHIQVEQASLLQASMSMPLTTASGPRCTTLSSARTRTGARTPSAPAPRWPMTTRATSPRPSTLPWPTFCSRRTHTTARATNSMDAAHARSHQRLRRHGPRGRPDGAHAVDVNEEDGARWHALHYAAQYGHAAAARKLLDLGADVDARDDINWTPMMRACEGKHLDVAMLLLERGADPEARNRSHNKSVKQICAERGLHPVVDRIEGRDREL